MKQDFITFFRSSTLAKIVVTIGVIVIILFIFEAGVLVGYHRAEFAEHWAEHYDDNFGTPGMMGLPPGSPNSHGASGRIVSVTLPTFVIASNGESEKSILVATDTMIRDGSNSVEPDDLVVGDYATVIGMPNDSGEIEAFFIRVMPPGTASTTP